MRRLPVIHATIVACVLTLPPGLARAQATGGPNDAPQGDNRDLYGADYYTAGLSPRLKSWLILVETHHVNERVWNAYRAGEYPAAIADTKYALERFPNHPRALGLMAAIGKATGQMALPINAYEDALKLYPQHAFTHAQYGRFLIDIGAVGAGIAELREALQLDPGLVSARAWLDEIEPAKSSPAPGDTARAN